MFNLPMDHRSFSTLPFPQPINYNRASWCHKSSTNYLSIWFWLKIFSLFLETMALCMATSYGLQASQMNEEPALESSLDLTLTQHPCDEDLKLREVPPCLWGWTLSSLVLFQVWWFCYKLTSFLMMNLKLSLNIFTKLKTPPSSHGL